MNVISHRRIQEFGKKRADARAWLEDWYRTSIKAAWKNLAEVRGTFRAADQVDHCLVFDQGNDYRLIVRVRYAHRQRQGTLFVKHFLTHAEYSKNRWKACCK